MTTIAIAGCGIIGAILAYELSRLYPRCPDLDILVIDRQPPARASTGAALGVMMGAISLKKAKSRAWKLRRDSLVRYETLIPELSAITGRSIPYNRHGILKLCTSPKPTLETWQTLADERRQQQFHLDILTPDTTADRFPDLRLDQTIAAVYSIDDRQVEPIPLLEAAIAAAQSQGVRFDYDGCVESGITDGDRLLGVTLRRSSGVSETLDLDALIVTAGTGSATIANALMAEGEPLTIMNVLGQALHLRPPSALPQNHPVITCDDVHIVPRSDGTIWVGATLEFPPVDCSDRALSDPIPDPQALDHLRRRATDFYPALEQADVISSWQGMRPRPVDRSAPVIEPIAGLTNALLATAHYRNGVLLAPATAQRAIEWVQQTQIPNPDRR
ncbi:MAG: FAD-binding oxidoreductase [Oscillatoriales cyanobacterium]|nr:MAG: FAD-binding oxidoreductase [Oscillatoriales cyanobacterium]